MILVINSEDYDVLSIDSKYSYICLYEDNNIELSDKMKKDKDTFSIMEHLGYVFNSI